MNSLPSARLLAASCSDSGLIPDFAASGQSGQKNDYPRHWFSMEKRNSIWLNNRLTLVILPYCLMNNHSFTRLSTVRAKASAPATIVQDAADHRVQSLQVRKRIDACKQRVLTSRPSTDLNFALGGFQYQGTCNAFVSAGFNPRQLLHSWGIISLSGFLRDL